MEDKDMNNTWRWMRKSDLKGLTMTLTIPSTRLTKLLSHLFVACVVHWQSCENLGFNRARFWYEHEPENVVENENFKIL